VKSSRQDSNAWYAWYPGDYQRDNNVRVCSLAARGLWHEMLDIMHDAPVRGTLTIGESSTNALQMTYKQLARRAGVSEAECTELINELEEAGVFSRLDDRTIYNRRMYRESIEKTRISEVRSDAVKTRYGYKQSTNGSTKDLQNSPMSESESYSESYSESELDSKSESECRITAQARGRGLHFDFAIPDGLTPEEAEQYKRTVLRIQRKCPKAKPNRLLAMVEDDFQKWRAERIRTSPRAREPAKLEHVSNDIGKIMGNLKVKP